MYDNDSMESFRLSTNNLFLTCTGLLCGYINSTTLYSTVY